MKNLHNLILICWACCLGAFTLDAYGQDSLGVEGVKSWLEAYGAAWEELDADKAVLIFAEDATYQVDPYSEPHVGHSGIHDYWSTVTSDQKGVDFTAEVLAVTDNTGIAHWHAEFTQVSSGARVTLDGIFVLQFSEEGKCSGLREWWNVQVKE